MKYSVIITLFILGLICFGLAKDEIFTISNTLENLGGGFIVIAFLATLSRIASPA